MIEMRAEGLNDTVIAYLLGITSRAVKWRRRQARLMEEQWHEQTR